MPLSALAEDPTDGILAGHRQGVAGHTSAGTEDSIRSLLVQLIGVCGLGFSGCKWGWDLPIPNSVPHRRSWVGWLDRLTTTPTMLYWQSTTLFLLSVVLLFKAFRTQDGISMSQSGSPVTNMAHICQKNMKNSLNTAFSAQVGDPAVVSLAITNCNFIE